MGMLVFPSCSAAPLATPLAFPSSSASVSVRSIAGPIRAIPDSKPPVSSDRISEVDNDDEDCDEDDEGNLLVGDLPLESKLLQKLEHKMKMKLAKKVRLRRKKLIRKRRMRKKGRWPPSKMNKLKNV